MDNTPDIEQAKSQDLSPQMIARESAAKETWFFERIGDHFIFSAEEKEAWEIVNNRSSWRRRDFRILGVSDGTTYKSVISKGKQRAIDLKNQFDAKLKEMQDYQRSRHRLLIDEAVDMSDLTDPVNKANVDKIKRFDNIIARVEKEVTALENAFKNINSTLIKEAFDAELAVAKANGVRMPRRMDVLTPNATPTDRKKIVTIMDGRVE